jgi:hypothetical protein
MVNTNTNCGGIWRAPNELSFLRTYNWDQTKVLRVKLFNSLSDKKNENIQDRLPYLDTRNYNQKTVLFTTRNSSSLKELWGTLVKTSDQLTSYGVATLYKTDKCSVTNKMNLYIREERIRKSLCLLNVWKDL